MQTCAQLEHLVDITNSIECEVSSRTVMLGCLTDGSTETFWESGDEDRNKPKVITIRVKDSSTPAMLAIHIDNSRDLRVSSRRGSVTQLHFRSNNFCLGVGINSTFLVVMAPVKFLKLSNNILEDHFLCG